MTTVATQSDPDTAAAEARYLAAHLLGRELDMVTIDRYQRARKCLPGTGALDPDIAKMVRYDLDAEAVELALRARGSLLTKRVHILLYLAEFQPNCFDLFVNTNQSRLSAIVQLGWHTLVTIVKWAKGKYLVRRYRLV